MSLHRVVALPGPSACRASRCMVPPAPGLMVDLLARFETLREERRIPRSMSFEEFFAIWRSGRRGENVIGLDDGAESSDPREAPQLIDRPTRRLAGTIRTLVLLADFDDQPHEAAKTPAHFESLLFGERFPTGSMRTYYREISRGAIEIEGVVHGWFRMPRTLAEYAGQASGTGTTQPNAQTLAADAVSAALARGVDFTGFDALGEGRVTALFIVHAGRGAEETGAKGDLWSLKWVVPRPIDVAPGIRVQTFLTVPEDCKVGVCAHEWGHLAARWADFYDTGQNERFTSNGLGNYCLMASGSWGNGGLRPTYPNGMLRMFHGWVDVDLVQESRDGVDLRPVNEGGGVAVLFNPLRMKQGQYVLCEYRRRSAQESFLPDEGIAIYVVDEAIPDVNDENHLAIELLQADGRRDLARIFHQGNSGDAGDLYPHDAKRTISGTTRPPLAGPDGEWTGIRIEVLGAQGDDHMKLDVTME